MIEAYEACEACESRSGHAHSAGVESVSAEAFYGEGYDDCDRRVPCIELACRLLDWTPRTPMREMIQRTVDAYLAAYAEPSEST